jgi:hypothetical protein
VAGGMDDRRRRLTPGRTAGEGAGEREDGGGRRLRIDGQQRDAWVGLGMMDWGRGVAVACWSTGHIGKVNRLWPEVESRCQIPNPPFF